MLQFINLELQRIKNNLAIFFCLVATALVVLWIGYYHKQLPQALGYLAAMLLCAVTVDIYAFFRPSAAEFHVRHPKKESLYVAVCLAIGLLGLGFRFMGPVKWEQIHGIPRLAVGLSMMLFVFPVAMAVILLAMRYKPRELGVRLHGPIVALPVIAIVFLTSRIVAADKVTWQMIYSEEGGIFMTFFTGIVTAGLSEEFMKMAGQTRFGALFGNKGAGWFVVTIIWALMHAPKWYSEGDGGIKEALIGAVRIIPIGLMWGYLTHRTKSILPAVLVHGTNFWGLQNF